MSMNPDPNHAPSEAEAPQKPAENSPHGSPVSNNGHQNGVERPPSMPTQSTPPNLPPKKNPENPWTELLKTLGLSLVLAVGIRHFVAEARYIPTESMVPTLEVNDRLIVEKISYRMHSPERGDVIVFIPPDAAGQACFGMQTPDGQIRKDAFIKRVIGLPGETVEVRDNQVFINNEPLQENYINAAPNYQWGPDVVPADSYLVLGDNRNNSCDGHFWGFVPRENIIGRAAFRFWPPSRVGGISPTATTPAAP